LLERVHLGGLQPYDFRRFLSRRFQLAGGIEPRVRIRQLVEFGRLVFGIFSRSAPPAEGGNASGLDASATAFSCATGCASVARSGQTHPDGDDQHDGGHWHQPAPATEDPLE
jgi:hypothetical protein